MAQGKGNKAKQRRHGKDARYYEAQYYITDRNKLRREVKRDKVAKSEKTLQRRAIREAKALKRKQANAGKHQARLQAAAAKVLAEAQPSNVAKLETIPETIV